MSWLLRVVLGWGDRPDLIRLSAERDQALMFLEASREATAVARQVGNKFAARAVTAENTVEALARTNVLLARQAEAAELLAEQSLLYMRDVRDGADGAVRRMAEWISEWETSR